MKYLDKSIDFNNDRITHFEFTNILDTLIDKYGANFKDYRKSWDIAANMNIIPEKPLCIHIGTNSYCNMSCKMCSQSIQYIHKKRLGRKDIDLELVDKISNEYSELKIPSVVFGVFCESTINPDIKKIFKKFSQVSIMDRILITNGSKLDQDFCNFLVDNQWERVYISLDASTEKTYKNIHGFSLKKIENGVQRLIETKKLNGSMFPLLRVSFVIQDENKHEVEQFYEKWESKVDIIDYHKLLKYTNDTSFVDNNKFKKCHSLFTGLTITCDGEILPCCKDYGKKMSLGNIRDMTLMDAWEGQKMKNLRNSFLDKKNPKSCQACLKDV